MEYSADASTRFRHTHHSLVNTAPTNRGRTADERITDESGIMSLEHRRTEMIHEYLNFLFWPIDMRYPYTEWWISVDKHITNSLLHSI